MTLRSMKRTWLTAACAALFGTTGTALAAELGEMPRFAVMPLQNLTGDAELDWLSIGLQDSLTVDLWYVSQLQTLALQQLDTAIERYCPGVLASCVAALDGRRTWRIAQDTKLETYLDGRYRKVGERIELQLIEKRTTDGAVLRETRIEAALAGLLAASSQALLKHLAAASVAVSPDAKRRIAAPKTNSLEAWRFNAEGYRMQMKFDGFRYVDAVKPLDGPALRIESDQTKPALTAHKAEHSQRWREALEQAVKMDPNYAEAINNLGYWHSFNSDGAKEARQSAIKPWFQKALALKPELIDALIGLGKASDGEASLAPLARAVELNPALTWHVNALDREVGRLVKGFYEAGKREQAAVLLASQSAWIADARWGTPDQRFFVGFQLIINILSIDPVEARRMLATFEPGLARLSPVLRLTYQAFRGLLAFQAGDVAEYRSRTALALKDLPALRDTTLIDVMATLLISANVKLGDMAAAKRGATALFEHVEAVRGMPAGELNAMRNALLEPLGAAGEKALRVTLAQRVFDDEPRKTDARDKLVIALEAAGKGDEAVALLNRLIERDAGDAALKLDHRYWLCLLLSDLKRADAERAELGRFLDEYAAAPEAVRKQLLGRAAKMRKSLAENLVAAGRGSEAVKLIDELVATARAGLPKSRLDLLNALSLKVSAARASGADFERTAQRELVAESRTWLESEMKQNYLWPENMGKTVPDQADTLQVLLDAMVFKERDHWSYVVSKSDADKASRGEFAGLGMDFMPDTKKRLRVSGVIANSPAAAAGIRRGDIIEGVGGNSIQDIRSKGLWSQSWGPSREGVPVKLAMVTRDGETRQVETKKTVVRRDAVPLVKVVEQGGKRVGYLQVSTFMSLTEDDVRKAIGVLKEQKATELVLDLRYNGGGRVDLSNLLASGIAGRHVADKIYVKTIYNDSNKAANAEERFQPFVNALDLKRLVVLTTRDTCSASESLINSLRSFIDVVTVGDRTCGKPVGMLSRAQGPWQISAINFELTNGKGEGRYFEGIKANCPMVDDFDRDLGDTEEGMFREALTYLRDGQCSGFVMRAPPSGREDVIGIGKRGLERELGAF